MGGWTPPTSPQGPPGGATGSLSHPQVQPEHPERQWSLRGAEGGQDHLGNLRLRLGMDLPERGHPALSNLGKKYKKE